MKILADTSAVSIRLLQFLQWSILVDKVLANTSSIMVSRKPSCKHTSAFWNTYFSALSPQRRRQEWQIKENPASLHSQEKNLSSIISKLKCNSITTALKEGFLHKRTFIEWQAILLLTFTLHLYSAWNPKTSNKTLPNNYRRVVLNPTVLLCFLLLNITTQLRRSSKTGNFHLNRVSRPVWMFPPAGPTHLAFS